ncbi:MAG: hypothetical protein HY288_05585 [Planctomycetia bacterium]|nr:hypothetical protein [Planctomycetia bacterium]
MNAIALVMSWWLLAQVTEPDRYKPRVVGPKAAPAVRIDDQEGSAAAEIDSATDNALGPRGQGPQDNDSPQRNDESRLSEKDDETHGRERGGPGEGDSDLAPVERGPRQKLRPPELLAQALSRPREGAIVGRPITLEAALSRTTDRQQQLKVAQAYWRLSTSEADYHWALDQRDKLAVFTENHVNSPGVQGARASARADVRDAQLAVTQAQQDLADLLSGAADESPPLAVDRPHVGDYRTLYDSLFNGRTPPPRIRLIHRTLPVRRKAIDAHGEAILATLDALESTGEDFRKSGHGLATVLANLDQLKHERRSFMSAVRDYNQDIAEYAFAVASPGASEKSLVAMLIKTSTRGAQPPRGGRPNTQPAEPPASRELDRQRGNEAGTAEESTSNYQPNTAPDAADDSAVYQGLIDLSPAERVQKLSGLLHWDRALPSDAGQPTALADCLRSVPPEKRLAVITAYWRSRERIACHQALGDELEQLNALATIAIGSRERPGVAGASVRLQATRLAAQAAVLEAQIALLSSGFELTLAAGRRLDDPWLLPATPPHSGRYNVAPDRSARGATAARGHWAKIIALQHAKLEERSEGVIDADAARALLVNEARGPAEADPAREEAVFDEPMPLDQAARAVTRQASETLAFLHGLTGYNLAIAHYALAAWPSLSSDELVKQLVIVRTAKGEG